MNEESLFALAREMATPGKRELFLTEMCGSDTPLRMRLNQLLFADAQALGILERGANTTTFLAACREEPLEAEHLFAERFRLIQKVGEGGMGEVWVADQLEPVQRRVALKVIRQGLDSATLMARFDQERQTLALMDHPNIARVIDAGTAGGRPYFVMDFIHGVPITRYCDEGMLATRQRLELFLPVARAVQHAHQKGTIHRDLKPTNILVTEIDGKPVPKVIDFGIAKATALRPCEHDVSTEVGTLVGTLEYMSPEQADLNGLDVDTRSDIYSLGVVLYELLTGGVPFPQSKLRSVPFTEMLRIIKEVEPPIPSARLRNNEAGTSTGDEVKRRGCRASFMLNPASFQELDWIVMKSLEKDRDRRYETAFGLAADLQRYLSDEPVLAGPPSTRYRARKFLRRNRGPVLAASLVLVALVAGIVGTTIGLVRAVQARQAEVQRAEGERVAKETAEKRLAQIELGIDVLGAVFDNIDPQSEEKDGRPLRAILGDQLNVAAAALEGDRIGDPLVVAKLQYRLGRAYLGLGQASKAESLFTKSLATHRAHFGDKHALTLGSMHLLALALEEGGKRSEAIALLEKVRDIRVKELGGDDLTTLHTLNDLGRMYYVAGRKVGVIELLEQVREARVRKLGPDNQDTLTTLSNLARAYMSADRRTEAVEVHKQVLDSHLKQFGELDRRSISAIYNLGFAYQAAYKMDAAIDLFEKARSASVLKVGADHPSTLTIMHGLAWMYRTRNRIPEAVALAEHVHAKRLMNSGAYLPSTLTAMDNLALTYEAAGDPDRALPLYQQAAVGMERLKFEHIEAYRVVRNYCVCLERSKQFGEAEIWRRRWLAAAKTQFGRDSEQHTLALTGLGLNLFNQKKFDEAELVMRECSTILQKTRPEDWENLTVQTILAATLRSQKRYSEAEPMLLQSYLAMMERGGARGKQHIASTARDVKTTLQELVILYDSWEKPDEAAKWRAELATYLPKKAPAPKVKKQAG